MDQHRIPDTGGESGEFNSQTYPPKTSEQGPPPPAGWMSRAAMFLCGQMISLFGSSIVQFAIIWYVTLNTKSGSMVALATICGFAPQIVISLFAGVWADRYNRKYLIIGADALIAVVTLTLAAAFLLGHGQLWMLFIAAGARSVGAGIQSPAVGAFIPQIVPTEKLMKFGGVNSSIQSLIMLISPAVSGAMYALSRLEYIFFLDVITAAIAIAIMLALKAPPHKKAAEAKPTGYFTDLAEGLRYIRKHAYIKSLLTFFAVFMFLIVPAANLTPLMVTRSFGSEVWRLTAIEVLFSLGSVLGGIVVAIWGGFKNRSMTLAASSVMFGLLTLALGFAAQFALFLADMLLMGLLLPFFNTATSVLLQERVDHDMQGRVFSFLSVVIASAMPLGTLVFGPAADVVPIELLLIGSGALLTLLGIWLYFDKRLKNI